MTKFLIAAAMAGVAGVALAQTPPPAPPAPPAAPHRMMMETQTRDQLVANVREHFGKMDANHDGAIAKDEIEAMRGQHMRMMAEGHGPGGPGGPRIVMREGPMGDPNAAFDRLDANKDGAISREEFAKAREQRIEKRIVMKDGKEAMVEPGQPMGGNVYMHKMRKGPGAGRGRHMRMMVMADGNGDGRITLAEAEAAALKHFDTMDANHDGKLTPEERREMRMQIRTERKLKAG